MSREPIERRWREGGGDATDQRIAGLLRRVSDPAPLPEVRLEQVAAALERPVPARRRRPVLRWAVAALVLCSGSAVFARHQIARLWEAVTAPAEPAQPTAAPAVPVRHPRPAEAPRTPAVAEAPPAPVIEAPPAPAASPPARQRVAVREAAISPPPRAPAPLPPPSAPREDHPPLPAPLPPLPARAVVAAPAPAGLAEEARLVRRALEELRRVRDPRAALALLDEHRARFAGGVLRADADLLRVEALLALDRGGEALAVLERVDLAGSPRADELAVTRGELRAARDCGAALADFERVLGGAAPQALAERALRGQVVCLLRLGDARSTAALRAYVDRFPQGPFAAEARRRLRLAP